MIYNYLIYFFLFAGVLFSIVTRKLTIWAALLGSIMGLLVFKGGGYNGFISLGIFFILGSTATSFGLKKKQEIGAADKSTSRRTAGQVIANGGAAAILGAAAWYNPALIHLMQLMMAGSLAAATADTLSSEAGTVLGKNFYNIITLKKEERGLDGVISIEGTLTGVVGSLIIASVYSIGHDWNNELLWIVIAGTFGNIFDSILGATLESAHLIGNNLVNFLNTCIGAAVCLLLFYL
ncbi:DUF92 domain-containing protein [Mucilaginibacter xinganensis]|uniref:TIGR00297 family protein n=1 Tax=Mucilaginibacter xinganensis TaxID=1234841 RepID=A0A223NZU9_9SPHI|nr:DUF92 domain-containing protein [Mucilaginibacter xinganensis]ASU35098.1 hypothetical protein MuYL_3213 [Mucilaginibacter xinganensis]